MPDLPDRPAIDERADSDDRYGTTRTLTDWGSPLPLEYGTFEDRVPRSGRDRDRRFRKTLSNLASVVRERVSNGVPEIRIDLTRLDPKRLDLTRLDPKRLDLTRLDLTRLDLARLAAKRGDETATEMPAPPLAPAWAPPNRRRPARPAPKPPRLKSRPASAAPDRRPEPAPSHPAPKRPPAPTLSPATAAEPSSPPAPPSKRSPAASAEPAPISSPPSWGPPIAPADKPQPTEPIRSPATRNPSSTDSDEPGLATAAYRPWRQADATSPIDRTALIEGSPFASAVAAPAYKSKGRPKLAIRRISVRSVLRISLVFYAVTLAVLVLAGLLLWLAADAFGALTSIDKSIKSLFALKSFTLHPGLVVAYTTAAGVVLAIAGTVANVIMAVMYNLVADLVGGIRVELDQLGE